MKLSENTIAVLKNFSTINKGMVLRSGKLQKQISEEGQLLAEVEIDEDIPADFGIYELSSFISNLNFFKTGEVDFEKDKATFKSENAKMTYFGAAPSLIKTPSKKLPDFEPIAKFVLPSAVLTKAIGLADLNGFKYLSFTGDAKKINMHVYSPDSGTSTNSGVFSLGDNETGNPFKAVFKTENLRLLPGEYTIAVNDGLWATFVDASGRIRYSLAMQTEEN